MPEIKPSAAITVKTDTPISEVIHKMKTQNVGSVVVLGATFPHAVEGMFTERDILRNIDLIQQGHWQKPVAAVMKRPVVKINLLEISKAGEVMLKNGFRHLPVVYYDAKNIEHLAGVVSMRDVFKYYVESAKMPVELKKGALKSASTHFNVGVITKDENSFSLIETILSQYKKASASEVDIKALEDFLDDVRDLPAMDVIVFDIDWVPAAKWGRYVKSFVEKSAAKKNQPYILVVYEPTMHEKVDIDFLKGFARSLRFAAFPKPIQVMALIEQLRQWS